ncbi:MAG: 2OG-Fe(II) oxygenase [Alphaproteobacteria bacterium]|nr:2OG-Fe(II) oxygenase [Alphaproteobacteria bacterium]
MIVIPALPVRNRHVSMVYHGEHFTREECEKIRSSADPNGWTEGLVGGHGQDGAPAVERKARSVVEQRVKFDQASGYPLSKVLRVISEVNSSYWQFELSGLAYDDMPYLMRYTGPRQDKYDWHIDMGRFHSASRKLSFSLQLTDGAEYDGGDLEFFNAAADRATFRKAGTMVIFPSYWMHRILPLTRGQRDVMVGWVHGPSYR